MSFCNFYSKRSYIYKRNKNNNDTMELNTATLRKVYKVRETANTYVFTNAINIHIELDKVTGSFVDGNIADNAETQKLFRVLFSLVK